jgi:hypothetical protein
MAKNDNTKVASIRKKLETDGRWSRFKLGDAEVEYVLSRGIDILRLHATDFIQKRIAPAEPKNDGRQTPAKGHPVFIAQHACGCHDRDGVATYFDLKKGKELSDKEVTLIVDLIIHWLDEQVHQA